MCSAGARRGRTTEAAERGELALWDDPRLFPAAGEGLYRRRHHLPDACEATSSQINYNSHAICLPVTTAPLPGDVIRGDPLTQGHPPLPLPLSICISTFLQKKLSLHGTNP